MKIRICHLYPDTLNLYGDRGNVLCIQKRLAWRGIDCQVDTLRIGEHKDLSGYDLFFLGGGQDFDQEVLLRDLQGKNGREILSAIADGRTFLCVCGGYQILGTHYETKDGHKCAFLGAADLYTVGGEKRLIGNYVYRLAERPGEKSRGESRENRKYRKNREDDLVVGFENHSGRTYLGSGVRPLGRVLKGYGNNGTDGTEGVRFNNVFGTYSHGPVLPKNPGFCDRLLKNALTRKYGKADLPPLEDGFENTAHRSVLSLVTGTDAAGKKAKGRRTGWW